METGKIRDVAEVEDCVCAKSMTSDCKGGVTFLTALSVVVKTASIEKNNPNPNLKYSSNPLTLKNSNV